MHSSMSRFRFIGPRDVPVVTMPHFSGHSWRPFELTELFADCTCAISCGSVVERAVDGEIESQRLPKLSEGKARSVETKGKWL